MPGTIRKDPEDREPASNDMSSNVGAAAAKTDGARKAGWWRWSSPIPTAARRSFRPTVRSIKSAVEAEQSRMTQMAAALSYRTIFGMIPVLVVSLVALKAFTTPAQIESLLGQAMRLAGLDKIAVDSADMPTFGTEPLISAEMGPPLSMMHEPLHIDSDYVQDLAPALEPGTGSPVPTDHAASTGSTRLDSWIKTTALSFDKFSLGAIGYVGLAMLIYAAVSMLVEVEHSFNQIFRVPTGRSWTRRITHYWTLLTLGTVLLAATFVVGQRFETWIKQLTQTNAFFGADKISVNAMGYLTTVLISTALFLLAYTVIPNTRVRLRPALVGALVAAILWETGKWAFSEYLRYSTGYQKFYGSIALIPLFLLWIYAAWLIVLFGLYVTYQLQHVRTKTVAQPADFGEPAIIDPASILSVVGVLAREFESGRSIEPKHLATKLGLYEPAVNQMLNRLAETGYVHRLKKGEQRPDEFALAMPPEKIPAEKVLTLGEELADAGGAPSTDVVAGAMRRNRLEAVRGRSLAELVGVKPADAAPTIEDASTQAIAIAQPSDQAISNDAPVVIAASEPGNRPSNGLHAYSGPAGTNGAANGSAAAAPDNADEVIGPPPAFARRPANKPNTPKRT